MNIPKSTSRKILALALALALALSFTALAIGYDDPGYGGDDNPNAGVSGEGAYDPVLDWKTSYLNNTFGADENTIKILAGLNQSEPKLSHYLRNTSYISWAGIIAAAKAEPKLPVVAKTTKGGKLDVMLGFDPTNRLADGDTKLTAHVVEGVKAADVGAPEGTTPLVIDFNQSGKFPFPLMGMANFGYDGLTEENKAAYKLYRKDGDKYEEITDWSVGADGNVVFNLTASGMIQVGGYTNLNIGTGTLSLTEAQKQTILAAMNAVAKD